MQNIYLQKSDMLFLIQEDKLNQRVDNFLFNKIKNLSKSYIYKIIRKGEVRVNKKRVKPEYKLQVSDSVRIPPAAAYAIKENKPSIVKIANKKIQYLEQQILYEDNYFLIIDKPSGLAVHGGSGLSHGVIEAIRQLRPEQSFLELGHRIDKETSGCLVLCKKRSALRDFQAQLRAKTVRKTYLALVDGLWPKSTKVVNKNLIKKQLESGNKIVKVHPDGKPATTKFQIQNQFPAHKKTLIQAFPISGRTHQIRVHCLSEGFPIAGDQKYNYKTENTIKLNRLFLHANKIHFMHYKTKNKIIVTSDLSPDLEQTLSELK